MLAHEAKRKKLQETVYRHMVGLSRALGSEPLESLAGVELGAEAVKRVTALLSSSVFVTVSTGD